jgi:hypothetical protein
MAGPRGIGSVYWPVGTNTHRNATDATRGLDGLLSTFGLAWDEGTRPERRGIFILDYELRLFGFATAYRDFPDAAVLRLQVRIGSMIAGDCGTSTIPQAEGRTPMAGGIL